MQAKQGDGLPPLVHCSSADVEALAAQWEQKQPEWRRVVSAACQQLHDVVLATEAYKPLPVQKLQVGSSNHSQDT